MGSPGQMLDTERLALLVRDGSSEHAAADDQRERGEHGHHAILHGHVHESGRARDGIGRGGRETQTAAQVLKRAVYALAHILRPNGRLLQDSCLVRKTQTLGEIFLKL